MQDALRRARLPLAMLIAFACVNMMPQGVTVGLTVYLPRYFAKHGAAGLAGVGAAFSLARLVDIGVDPALGVLMDRTRTRFGRYRPYMLAGGPILTFAIYMLFMARPDVGQVYLVGWLLVAYAGGSLLYLSQSAWAGVLSGEYAERARIYGMVGLMGLLGPAVVLLAPKLLGGQSSSDVETMHLMAWTLIVLTPVLTLTAALATPEPARAARPHERATLGDYARLLTRPIVWRVVLSDLCLSMVMTATMSIFMFFWRDARGYGLFEVNMLLVGGLVAGMFGAPFWGWLGGRIGKHVALVLTAVSYAAANIVITHIPPGNYLPVFVVQACLGFAGASFTMLLRALVADLADQTRLEQGRDCSGVLFSLVTSTMKIGGALSVGLTFGLLEILGYRPAGANTPEQARNVMLVYTWVPVFFCLAGAAFVWRYPLTASRHAEIRAALEVRDQMDADVPSSAGGAATEETDLSATGRAMGGLRGSPAS